ncbi:uncharacterized protein LOC117304461 [Asterias rubens]|uniref:uncharacterized protein LOC117304461 n=1 Tax=Asterias rubens TaxID=7604 RepID=UPI001455795C|nr:uncharacterized protein LOC117304461 [Asterias rubens]
MAERITVESVLQKISHRHLECQICKDRFKEPKMLECSHSYCMQCLQQLAETNHTSPTLICPVCRAETFLFGKGVVELRTDFRLTSMLDEIEQHESLLQKQQAVQPRSKGSVSKCSKHTDMDVIMYCDSCKQLICTTCIAKDHKMHPATELNEVLDKCKKKTKTILAEVGQHRNNFMTALKDIGMCQKLLDTMFVATKAKISKKADEEIAKEAARIRGEEKKLMVELAQAYKDRATKIETAIATNNIEVTKGQNTEEMVNQLMDELNFCENLNLIEELLQNLQAHTKIQPMNMPNGLTYIDYEDDQTSLGRLVMKDRLELEDAASAAATQQPYKPWTKFTKITRFMDINRQIQNICASDVASYHNSTIVVCDFKRRSLIKISADSIAQSKVLPKELSIKGLINPSRVTVNKNDELIVVDNTEVKIFNGNYRCIHQFRVNRPSCIAVDENNLIAVVSWRNSEISLHEPDGSLIRKLPAPGIGRHFTIHKQQIIYLYTNMGVVKLVALDYFGGTVFSVNTRLPHRSLPVGGPNGVCCDEKDGRIYIAVCERGTSYGEIQHYSPKGNFIGCIMKWTRPNCIILTPAGDLVMATDDSVKIYYNK